MDFTTGEELAQLAERCTLINSEARPRYSLQCWHRLMRSLGHSLGWTKRKRRQQQVD